MIAQAWLASRYVLIWYVSCNVLDTNSGVAGGYRLAGRVRVSFEFLRVSQTGVQSDVQKDIPRGRFLLGYGIRRRQ
jgi:hypothetical protein